MSTVAELMIKLGMDDAGLDKGMSSSGSKLKSWGESLRSVGTKLTAGVTLPLVGAGIAAINWASDQQEASNKVDVVFGKNADAVKEWADSNKGSLLMSSGDAMEAAGTYGNLFTSMGMGQEQAAGLSTGLVELAQDLSSFNNVPTDTALVALRAALVGEYEPMRALGVQLSQATVEQKALEMGIWDGNGALTAQQRVLATNELIMEQTTNAQGDAARTAKGFANQMRILRANLEDVGAAMGKKLLPFANRFLTWALEMLDVFSNLDGKWQVVIMAIAGIAAAIGPLLLMLGFMLPALGALATAFGVLLSPIGLVVLAIAALIGLGIYAWVNDLWGVRDAVDAVIDAFVAFGTGLNDFRKYIQAVLNDGDLMNDWLTHFPDALQPIILALGQAALALHNFWNLMGPVLGDFYDALQALGEGDWREVLDELQEAFLGLGEAVSFLSADVLQILADYFNDLADSAGRLEPTLSMLSQYLGTSADAMHDLADAFSAALAGDWGGFFENIGYAALNLVKALGEMNIAFGLLGIAIVTALVDGLQNAWTNTVMPWMAGRGVELLTAASDWALSMVQAGADLITGLLNGLALAWPFIVTWATGLGLGFVTAVGDLTTTLLQKGLDLLTGLLDGMIQRLPTLQAWLALVGAVALAAVGDVTKSLLQKGKDLISGVIDGLNDRWEQAKYWLSLVGSYAIANVGSVTSTLTQKGRDLIQGLIDGLNNRFEFAKAWLSLVPSQAASAVGYAGSALYDAGVQLISGMVNGVVSMATSLANAVINAVDGAIQAGKDRLNIGSPSKVFYQIGVQTAQGLVLGIGSMEDRVSAAGEAMAAAAVSSYGSEFAGTATSTGGEAAVIHIHNTYALTPADLLRVLQDSETGASFARGFGSELGLYTGQP